MRSRGRRPSFTKEERERVLALAEQGTSQRDIAEDVFGDVRYRGRVERILAREAAASDGPPSSRKDTRKDASAQARPGSDLELFRELVARAERCLLDSEEAPSLSDIQRLMRVKRSIKTLETIERSRRRGRTEQ